MPAGQLERITSEAFFISIAGQEPVREIQEQREAKVYRSKSSKPLRV